MNVKKTSKLPLFMYNRYYSREARRLPKFIHWKLFNTLEKEFGFPSALHMHARTLSDEEYERFKKYEDCIASRLLASPHCFSYYKGTCDFNSMTDMEDFIKEEIKTKFEKHRHSSHWIVADILNTADPHMILEFKKFLDS